MNLKDFDLFVLTNLLSQQVDHVTCFECCKYYIAPETAACGHTLCHACWRGRRACPACALPLDRKSLKLNLQMQHLTEHVHTLGEAFEKLFNIKLDDFVLDASNHQSPYEADPTKNVKEWLASSQNQFSAPLTNSELLSQDIPTVELSKSKIQVHMNSKKSKSPQKVVYVPPPQDDWDKIEPMPDTEDVGASNKENQSNKTNKPQYLMGDEYTTDNPRRSSRKREYTPQKETDIKVMEKATDKPSSKNSSSETEKKSSNKAKQNWNSVKRMRKEFSKLNKRNRSKLNVSIEMCKKTQSTTKPNIDTALPKLANKDSQPYTIEDNTPGLNAFNTNITETTEPIKPFPNDVATLTKDDDVVMASPDVVTKSVSTDINKINKQHHSSVLSQKKTNNVQDKLSMNILSENVPTNLKVTTNTNVPFITKTELCSNCSKNGNLEDIEITFKIGNTLTNITIKRKNNDVQLRVKADREVQTSLGTNCLVNNSEIVQNVKPQEIQINIGNSQAIATQIEDKHIKENIELYNTSNKSKSTKKNTASADTATAQFEITESVEKELSNVMECVETLDNNQQDKSSVLRNIESERNAENLHDEKCDEYINDLDIFDSESMKEQQVQVLDRSKQTASEILMPTIKTKSQKHPDKRNRDRNDDNEVPSAKKIRTTLETVEVADNIVNDDSMLEPCPKDSESINYDVVMGQVFASIDADIEKSQKSTKHLQGKNTASNKDSVLTIKTQNTEKIFESQRNQANIMSTQKSVKPNVNEKYSENIFSMIEKDDEKGNDEDDMARKKNGGNGSTQRHIENLLTPGMCQDLIGSDEGNMDVMNKEHCTPFHDHDDSDKSVVEETPQKNVSFPKPKNASDTSKISNQLQRANTGASRVASSSQLVKSIINVSDTLEDTTKTNKDLTVVEPAPKKTLETPLTINKFVDHIKHKSTPVARKSLNFESENIDDIDQTICPSSVVAKTTQEKEFMAKAFEETQKSPIKNSLMARNVKVDLKYCIAGSCLSAAEVTNIKYLCQKYNWKYVDKYTKELTHLVVGVDEDNRSQRSVKYMCALAASKWIVSYEWVQACIATNLVVGEALYEALDGTGEPGPQRSRLAQTKLFEGITFYCMPPFSVLDVNTLKGMLEAAGGRVAGEARAVRAAAHAPALLLAEPEHTQEDRFIYLALELKIVPVNYEWVLNCLGAYTLSSVHELLMCPAAILPAATASWPEVLIARENY